MAAFAGVDTARLLTEAMRVSSMSHRHLANNIANADTPGFTPTELDFDATLRAAVEGRGGSALRAARPRRLGSSASRPEFERLAFLSKNDYNKVDLDDQLAKLSENTGKHGVYARLLAKRFETTKAMLSDLAR